MTRVLLVPDLPLERWPAMDRYAHRLHDWLESTDPGFEVRLAAHIGELVREVIEDGRRGARYSGGYPRWWAQEVDPTRLVLPGPLREPQRYAARYVLYPWRLRREARRARLVHILDHSYAHMVTRVHRRPVVVTVHDLMPVIILRSPTDGWREGIRNRFLRRTLRALRLAQAYIVGSEWLKAELATWLGDDRRVSVVPFGVDRAFFSEAPGARARGRLEWRIPDDAFLVLHVGSTVERKNVPLVIQTVARLRTEADAYLLQVGGRFTGDQERLVERLDLRRYVRSVPFADETTLRRAYRAADVLLFPSLYEGFGFPVLEAFASGLPVVTSGAGGLREVGGDAIVVVEGRDPLAYVQALEALSDDPARRDLLIARGRVRAREFSWQRTAEKTAEVYRKLLSAAAVAALAGLLQVATACGDRSPSGSEGSSPTPPPVLEPVTCQADARAGTLGCAPPAATPADRGALGASTGVIVGGQGTRVQLASRNVRYDETTETFQADVTVQNLTALTLGTPDASTVTGVKVFFHSGPSVVSGNGAATVANADGAGAFTGTNQPYFLYQEMLPTGRVSSAKRWQWSVSRTVQRFTFQVLVTAAAVPPTAVSCLTQGGPAVALRGVQTAAYENAADDATVDASAAQFVTGQDELVPVRVSGARACYHGGEILGPWPPSTSWDFMRRTYGLLVDAPDVTVENVRLFNYGNGISFDRHAANWTVRGAYIPYGRDGCIENDFLFGGTVDDAFIDGCYVPFAVAAYESVDGSDNVMTVKNSLVRVQAMDGVYSGAVPGNLGVFEWDELGPKLALFNNVFRVDQEGSEPYLAPPPGTLVDCANNVMIWLGPGPFAETLPATFQGKRCFTLLTGQEGLDYWNDAAARWRAAHPALLPDAGPPVVSLFSPGVVGSTTLRGAVRLTATAADDRGLAGVQFRLDGRSIGPELTADSPLTKFTLSWNSRDVANATYTLTATARDGAGHVTTSPGITVTIRN